MVLLIAIYSYNYFTAFGKISINIIANDKSHVIYELTNNSSRELFLFDFPLPVLEYYDGSNWNYISGYWPGGTIQNLLNFISSGKSKVFDFGDSFPPLISGRLYRITTTVGMYRIGFGERRHADRFRLRELVYEFYWE